ncbi:MAG: methionyl-tRNA formyltransferase [Bacteroidota bacterium]|nr:methionyl-tRNA formyltransferase [Bacteroidota bacterium]
MSIEFAFIGGTNRGYKLIEALIEKEFIPKFAIILKEDEHEQVKYSDKISGLLNKNQIVNSIKKKLTETEYNKIQESNLDFVIVSGWRTLINTKVSRYIKFGLIAAHHSLLPKYRGFAPTQWAIINGETETGVTLFLINEGEADSGKIIAQEKTPILFEDYAIDLDNKLINCTIKLFLEFFVNYQKKKIVLTKQNESDATYTCKRTPQDGRINWSKNSLEVYNFIRALAHPFTGAFCEYNNNLFYIRRARLGDNNNKNFAGNIPGRVIKINPDGIEVLCGNGTILITEWENKIISVVNCPSENIKSINSTLK